MTRGFARVCAGVPQCRVADIDYNVEHIIDVWRRADAEGCAVLVLPELAVTGYTVRDLFLDHHLLDRSLEALHTLIEASRSMECLAFVGLPLRVDHALYNVAVAVHQGEALGVVPKAYLPNYREFEETRWFRPGVEVAAGSTVRLGGKTIPFGTDVLFDASNIPDLMVGVEICEDYWVQIPPSSFQAGAGATVLCNLSASNFVLGKAEVRRTLALAHSDRTKSAYLYVAAGPGESSTDLAFDADAFICEAGEVLEESKRFLRDDQIVVADIDLDALVRSRMSTNSFGDCAREHGQTFRIQSFQAPEPKGALRRRVAAHPFLPDDTETLARRCWEVFEIQSNALTTRMRAIGRPKLVLGVSGGLDSTHAALVAAQALDLNGQSDSDLLCVTMPGLGTTDGTRENAEALAGALGAEFRQIDISEESRVILKAMGHPAADGANSVDALVDALRNDPALADVAVENVQARLRTLILMSIANREGGIVVGTGDLSEKALGWSTYSGDHISMYDVNAGVPKTLIRFVIRWVANERVQLWSARQPECLRETLFSVLETPISPELLPADEAGRIAQLTEATIGPYELHDFFLYHFVGHGRRPARILDLAQHAFGDRYDPESLAGWLKIFLTRFFRYQFKRSCTADAPKVLPVSLSPRGDWRMPSDAQVEDWLDAIELWVPR